MPYTTDVNSKITQFVNRAQTKLGEIASLSADKQAKGARFDSYRDQVDLGFELHSFVNALDNNWNDWTEPQIVQYIDKWTAKANLNLTPYYEHEQYNLHITFDPSSVSGLPSLSTGYIWLGDALSVANPVTISGAISLSLSGVATLTSNYVTNAHINSGAAIALSKLATVTGDRVIVSSSGGVLQASSISTTIFGYIANLTSDAQAQIDAKEPTLTKGNLSETGSSVLTITGGSNAVIGSGVTIEVSIASGSTSGYLTSTDWTTFNNKQNAITQGNLTETTSNILTITGGSNAVIGSGVSIEVQQAGASTDGYLSSVDWNIFNNKGSFHGLITDSGTTYNVAAADIGKVLNLTNTAARTVNLVAAVDATPGLIFWIKDAARTSTGAPIYVVPDGSDTFEDGGTSLVLSDDGIVAGVYSDGTSKWYLI